MSSHKQELMSKISLYKTSCGSPARVLLLGPVGSGKSSFISSVQSIFSGRVLNHAMVGSSTAGFTKKVGQNQNSKVQMYTVTVETSIVSSYVYPIVLDWLLLKDIRDNRISV